jgi:hypothetical protein
MISIRKGDARGRASFGWLDSRHSFSFGSYYDPDHMGFGDLRVINEDVIEGGTGFGEHGHRDMEILTLVLDGALAHRDSTGGSGIIRPGEIQRMSAGTGIRHSEMNASYDTRCHFLQIWILPERAGLAPGYEQAPVPDGRLVTLAARDGTGAVRINQDARVLLVRPTAGTVLHHALGGGRGAWLHVVNGTLAIDGHELAAGDAAAVTGTETVAIRADRDSSLLVFDVRV